MANCNNYDVAENIKAQIIEILERGHEVEVHSSEYGCSDWVRIIYPQRKVSVWVNEVDSDDRMNETYIMWQESGSYPKSVKVRNVFKLTERTKTGNVQYDLRIEENDVKLYKR